MKVLLVIDSLGSGGAQRLMVYLAKGLINNGNKVDVFIYNTNYNFFREDIESMGVKIYTSTLKKKYLKPISIIYSLTKTLNNNYDIVISLMHMPSVYSAFSCIGLFQTKLIVCELSSSNAPISFFKRLLFYLASLLSFKVVANSFTEKINIEKRPRLSGKVEAIWNGYEINKMKFTNYFASNARQWDKIRIEIRLGGLTLFELKSDLSNGCFKFVIFNLGVNKNCNC